LTADNIYLKIVRISLLYSYDHIRDDKPPTSTPAATSESNRSHSRQISASPQPVHLYTPASTDVTSQMTSLKKVTPSHFNTTGTM